jgi:TolB-like protein/AraC-like DNA-binding protein/Tfp pilus assembly protein PilF
MNPTGNNEDFLQHLGETVFQNLENEQFGVEELAVRMGISRSQLHRRVRRLLHKTVIEFIREVRLKEAMELLLQGNLTAAEIAYKTGFSSPSYFNKCFHDQYGYPPGEAKRAIDAINSEEQKIENSGKRKSEPGWVDNVTEKVQYTERKIHVKNKWVSYVAIGLLIALAGMLLWHFLSVNKTRSVVDKSIAVIPFRDDSEDEYTRAFTNGVMEGVINNLANISGLRIPGRTSIEQFRETTATIPQIGEILNVSYILEGSVQKFGSQVKVNIQLLLSKTDELLWSDSYEYTYESQFKIITEIAKDVAREIEVQISPEENQRMEKIPTSNLTANYFYQRGRDEIVKYWSGYSNRKEALDKAEDCYRKAIECDSSFALAYTGLADIYWYKHYWETFLNTNFLDSMLTLADIALSFDNQLAEAYIVRGDYFRRNNKREQAIKEYDKAIKFNPNSGKAYRAKGFFYFYVDLLKTIDNLQKASLLERGRGLPGEYRNVARAFSTAGFKEKAHRYAKEALKLDGDSAAYYSILAWVENESGNFKKAIEFGERSYSFDSSGLWNNYYLGLHHSYLGHNEAYLAYMKKTEKISKTLDNKDPWFTFRIGHAYWINGFKTEAEPYFNSALEVHNKLIEVDHHPHQEFHTFYNLAAFNAFFGEKAQAFENLRRLNKAQKMPIWLIKDLKNDPLFENIRDEPEFQQIVKDVESKFQAEHERVRQWLEENDMI